MQKNCKTYLIKIISIALFTVKAHAIIGGIDAADGSSLSNHVLSLVSKESGRYYWNGQGGMIYEYGPQKQCSAVALSKRVVLTAAHCWNYKSNVTHFLKVKDGQLKDIEIPIYSKKVHELYLLDFWGYNYNYDLALLQLSQDLPDNIKFANLPEYKDQIKFKYVNAAGFGKTNGTYSSDVGTGFLRVATLKVNHVEQAVFKTDQQHGKGICHGDSGGPAYAISHNKTYLVGIVSIVSGKEKNENIHRNACDDYGVFVRVDNNLSWIKKNLKQLNSGERTSETLLEKIKIHED